jgi:hypothetical protein
MWGTIRHFVGGLIRLHAVHLTTASAAIGFELRLQLLELGLLLSRQNGQHPLTELNSLAPITLLCRPAISVKLFGSQPLERTAFTARNSCRFDFSWFEQRFVCFP